MGEGLDIQTVVSVLVNELSASSTSMADQITFNAGANVPGAEYFAQGQSVRCACPLLDPDDIFVTGYVNVMYDFQFHTLEAYTNGCAPTAWQWKVSTSRNGTYTNISGAVSPTYTVPVNFITSNPAFSSAVNNELFFKCEMTNYAGTTLQSDANALGIEFIRTNTSGYGTYNGVRYLTIARARHLGTGSNQITFALLNLGASGTGACTNGVNNISDNGLLNDAGDLGDYYQWGRVADGHQHTVWSKNPSTRVNTFQPATGSYSATSLPVAHGGSAQVYTSTLQIAATNTPYYGSFITGSTDWGTGTAGAEDRWGNTVNNTRVGIPLNLSQWTAKARANNPCPTGWYIPSRYDGWDTYRGDGFNDPSSFTGAAAYGSYNNTWRLRNVQANTNAWGGVIIANAAGEKLFLPTMGYRMDSNAAPSGTTYFYGWTSTFYSPVSGGMVYSAAYDFATGTNVNMGGGNLGYPRGVPVRCVRNN